MTETKKPKGGRQPGAGRKPLPPDQKRIQRNFYLTEEEFAQIKQFLAQLRNERT